MAKLTYWAGDHDAEPEDAKKRTGPRPNPLYSRADDGVYDTEREDIDRRFFYGDSFDDSDTRWYRKGSFRFDKKADYSPRSLFRSEFSSSSWYTVSDSSNEAKNKAIRVLRELTRSANTIVDTATGHAGYVVQYSRGTDNNAATDVLSEEKQRIVYVSAASVTAAKTPEEEDEAVDALTGFVMLRVQIAQTVSSELAAQLSATGLNAIGVWLGCNLLPGVGGKILDKFEDGVDIVAATDEHIARLAQAGTTRYLAGELAKTFLMRAARRSVVSNWGGFAPYFVRHAKKFAHIKTTLEEKPTSVEVLVGKLGYNMLADAAPITLPESVDKLADKYFSAEVPPEELLAKCVEFVTELRGVEETAGPGDVEKAIVEALKNVQEEHKKLTDGSKTTDDVLKDTIAGLQIVGTAAKNAGDRCASGLLNLRNHSSKLESAEAANETLRVMRKRAEPVLQSIKAFNSRAAGAAVATKVALLQELGIQVSELFRAARRRPVGLNALRADATKAKKVDEMLAACSADMEKVHNRDMLAGAVQAFMDEYPAQDKKLTDVKSEALAAITAAEQTVKDVCDELTAMYPVKDAAVAKIDAHALHDFSEVARGIDSHCALLSDICARALTEIEDYKVRVGYCRSEGGLTAILVDCTGTLNSFATCTSAGAAANNIGAAAPDALKASIVHGLLAVENATDPTNVKSTRQTMLAEAKRFLRTNSTKANGASRAASIAAGLSPKDCAALEKEATDRKLNLGAARKYDTTMSAISALREALQRNSLENPVGASDIRGKMEKVAEKLAENQTGASAVDQELFGSQIEAGTVLTTKAVEQVNSEARNAAEEEFVAYLNSDNNSDAKPVPVDARESYLSQADALNFVNKIIQRHRAAIERIRSSLVFQNHKRIGEEYGLRSGDLDEGNLHKLKYDCEHIWSQKVTAKLPDVAVAILVDQSGSMCGEKIAEARELCIVMAEALRKIGGVRLYVYGHTANMVSLPQPKNVAARLQTLTVYEHYTPTNSTMGQLGQITAHANNYDGYAIKEVAKRLAKDTAKTKYLFVIADGMPAGCGYHGDDAQKHVKSVCKFVRDRLKINLYAFGVGIGTRNYAFTEQYGADKTMLVPNVMKCLPQIARFLRNMMQKERRLVSVE